MRKLIIVLTIIFSSVQLMSQNSSDYTEVIRGVLQTEKKIAIAEIMNLEDHESEAFWQLYNEFNEKTYKIQTKRLNIIIDYAENYENLSQEKADELWTSYVNYKQDILTLNKQYYKKFKKILPIGKAAKYFQAENKIAILVDFQLASEIPIFESK